MSREHLSINSLTGSSPPPPPEPPTHYHLQPQHQREYAFNRHSRSPPSHNNKSSIDSPTSYSSASCVSPPQFEMHMSRYPNSMDSRNHRTQSLTDPSSSSSGSNNSHANGRTSSQEPMSLDERRKRNKAASAKYRAKKQIQISQMSNEINLLTEENSMLQKRLKQVCEDNDILRSKIIAMEGSHHQVDDGRRKKESQG
ncbi:hypothetical protein Unana1_02405 [Umbelopsis nana]